VIYISPTDLDAVASILWAGMPLCRYELAIDISDRFPVITALQVIDKLRDDRVIIIHPIHGHPLITGMARCTLCGWCPVHSAEAHSDFSQAETVLPVHHYMPMAPQS
jgi:hypothetical protein